ncbi:uncharacterized protein NECHADRAFT_86351 [Fusarium vanettenii 77-13-4]|uniref:Uncharacterized protein n=1 Tax=Fusarium vanettenii (strain ATCC MYA-4622 / CBS 123669 / FGSC 9596 / NRRL 45880 / 77-13-4) TaxID=660122 RepID=C7ZEZ4_FUSV7|nr:uncharacterized protein NECHADRAFT_86351 [Fusarium vanettenii 77-13-4]EEU37483.1 predicted protein [Fusarium vanettenii 77-13-4]
MDDDCEQDDNKMRVQQSCSHPYNPAIRPREASTALRAANLEKDFSLSLSPDHEEQWSSNWSSNSLSLKSFLRCRSWVRLRVPAEPRDDIVDTEVVFIEESEDEDDIEGDNDDDQVQTAYDEPALFAENEINKSNEEFGVEQNAATALMAFYSRGNNDSLVEETPLDVHRGYQLRLIPQSDRYFAHRATRSTYFTTQQYTSTFPQHRPTVAAEATHHTARPIHRIPLLLPQPLRPDTRSYRRSDIIPFPAWCLKVLDLGQCLRTHSRAMSRTCPIVSYLSILELMGRATIKTSSIMLCRPPQEGFYMNSNMRCLICVGDMPLSPAQFKPKFT